MGLPAGAEKQGVAGACSEVQLRVRGLSCGLLWRPSCSQNPEQALPPLRRRTRSQRRGGGAWLSAPGRRTGPGLSGPMGIRLVGGSDRSPGRKGCGPWPLPRLRSWPSGGTLAVEAGWPSCSKALA